ncbi:MAG: hypothetical protein OEZ22_02025 [Spirochaetia bacterium]|nr:hypothetical protein [Spirochaetia bacterium]
MPLDSEKNKDKSTKKKSASKKDFLQKAVEEELNNSSLMGDFIEDIKKRNDLKNDEKISNDNLEKEKNKKNKKKFFSREKKKKDNQPENEAPSEIKDNVSGRPKEKKMEEDNDSFEPIESKDTNLPEITRENKKRIITAIVIFLIILFSGAGVYFFLKTETKVPRIYLSTARIDKNEISSMSFDLEENFSLNEPIYFYFTTGQRLAVEKLIITVLEIYENPDAAKKEQLAGLYQVSVNPGWSHLETYFQKEVFEHAGRYKMQISSIEGKILAERTFSVR